jgi:hypothetical protein
MEKLKLFTLLGLELDPSVVQPAASRYTDCATMALSSPGRSKIISLPRHPD